MPVKKSIKTKKLCPQGHSFFKSSECPTCPICEQLKKPAAGFLSLLSNPARRALEHAGIKTLKKLAQYSEKEILKLHGMGPASLPILRKQLKEVNLSFSRKDAKK